MPKPKNDEQIKVLRDSPVVDLSAAILTLRFAPNVGWPAAEQYAHKLGSTCALLAAADLASTWPSGAQGQLSQAGFDVLTERARQQTFKDWTTCHDDEHPNGEIAAFAAVYAMPPATRDWPAKDTGYGDTFGAALCPEDWHPKFGDRRRELVKAGALVLAEIERIDRAAAHKAQIVKQN